MPRTKLDSILRLLMEFCAGIVLVMMLVNVVREVHAVPRSTVIDNRPNEKFGLPLEKRREIFREFADAEPNARSKGHSLFPDHAWSAEDDRAATEHHLAHALSIRTGISLTRIYLALTDGIANHWVGSDGQPLPATTEPLLPRQK